MLSSLIAFLIIYLYKNINLPSHKNSAENILILFIIPVIDMVRLFLRD